MRHDFDNMKFEDKAAFLVEAGVSTLIRGVEQVSRSLADELDRAFSRSKSGRPGAAGDPPGEGAPAPNVSPEPEGPGPDDIPGPGPKRGPRPMDEDQPL